MADFRELDENGEEQKRVETELIKCPSCGANMVFDPESQMLYCSHCGTKQSFANDLKAKEIDLLSGFNSERQWSEDETSVFRCDNCGAKVVLSKGETAKTCPFCGTAHVQKTDELAGIKPNGLLPFKFGAEEAKDKAKAWAKKRLFAPKKFKRNISTENVKGVYTPCFTFDSRTTSTYSGRIGTYHTRTVGSGKNRRVETYIVWRNISGQYFHLFDDILITAGSKFNQKQLDKISPYSTGESCSYQENFLLGFMAYHYDKEITDCWNEAKSIIDDVLRKRILNQYTYDVVGYLNVSTKHEGVTYKYVMLPVYIGNFNYNKKLYNFFINGTNGKTYGKTPVSPWKVLFTVLLGLVVVGAIAAAVYFIGKS